MRLFFFIFILGHIFCCLHHFGRMVLVTLKRIKSNSISTLLASQSRNIPQFINESYTNPSVGFHILLPGGWKGVSYQNIAMVSPAGVHLMNGNLGPNGDKVLMVIEALNVSDFLYQERIW